MNTQVIFKIDRKLKEKAMQKAKSEGIALSSVLKLATEAFVEGALNVGLVAQEKFNTKTRKELAAVLKEIRSGKNLSKSFDNPDDFIKDLNRKR